VRKVCIDGLLQLPHPRPRYTELDVRRVLAAAKKAGVNVRVEIAPDGKIVVVTGPSSEAANTSNPWDKVLDAAPEQKRAP
jgi:hypothetical protein